MPASLFTLRIATNGQPYIETRVDVIADAIDTYGIHGRTHHFARNGGFDLTFMTDRAAVRDVVKAACPAAPTRLLKNGVRVAYPADMVAARDAIDADWQRWAGEGVSHAEMQHRAINHAAYAPFLAN